MGTIEETVSLPAPPQRVWEVVSDPARFGDWLTMHRSWAGETPAAFAQGDRVTQLAGIANIPITITWTVDAYEPPRAVRLSGTALLGVAASIALDIAAEGDGASRLAVTVAFDGPLLAGPIGAAIDQAARHEVRASTEKLRVLLA